MALAKAKMCSACGRAIPHVAVFCPQCGADQGPVSPRSPASRALPPVLLPILSLLAVLMVVLVASVIWRNVEEAREATDRRRLMNDAKQALGSLPPSFGTAEKAGPITESERMERQYVLDEYEKARQRLEALQSDPNVDPASRELQEIVFRTAEMAKRQSDIEWQKRLESQR